MKPRALHLASAALLALGASAFAVDPAFKLREGGREGERLFPRRTRTAPKAAPTCSSWWRTRPGAPGAQDGAPQHEDQEQAHRGGGARQQHLGAVHVAGCRHVRRGAGGHEGEFPGPPSKEKAPGRCRRRRRTAETPAPGCPLRPKPASDGLDAEPEILSFRSRLAGRILPRPLTPGPAGPGAVPLIAGPPCASGRPGATLASMSGPGQGAEAGAWRG